MHNFTLTEAKQRLLIPGVWRLCGLPGEPRKSCRCPFHDDHSASFSISPDGLLWNCFAGCGGGDAVEFFQRARGLSQGDACRKFIELAGGHFTLTPRAARLQPQAADTKPKPTFPDFHKGTPANIQHLASLREISREGIEWASERGLLCFATLKDCPAWVVTDGARVNAQARRLDGQEWEHVQAKASTLPGSWASWPIGIKEALPFPAIALCEGGPDFIACHFLSLWEQATHHSKRDVQCSPVAMLGASQRIHPDALPLFAGKHVRIFCHADEAGQRAARRWAEQLVTVDVKADAFDFSGLERADGKPAKDLNDCLLLNADGFGQTERMLP